MAETACACGGGAAPSDAGVCERLRVTAIENRALSPLVLLFLKTFRSLVARSLAKRK